MKSSKIFEPAPEPERVRLYRCKADDPGNIVKYDAALFYNYA